ncbi:hypothetical protein GUJ93_ZPchr0006g44441 [Zizania palustris]|uniref:Aminoacyl-tRNA synthetase class II (G/ P/ S/T) domain-containing protein n=1 Tax=Zizania palustris TaxID=103762 RepID=A0A8J5SHB3_ZIZPA|nr:hypothetical protein GUJ93_ZPchr0006g44441 [Zizania palustris]
MAVQKLFPNSQVTIGPWIDNGFSYDFDMEPLTDKDLKKIKKEIDRIIRKNLPLVREEVSREEAKERIETPNEPYKLEILEDIEEEPITVYHIGSMFMLIHLQSGYDLWMVSGQLDIYFYKENMYNQMDVEDELYQLPHVAKDDAHIFCLDDEIKDEIRGVLALTERILGQKYKVEEGGGVFYGPKIDFKIEDALGRKCQCSTVQVGFNLPERFGITYINSNTELSLGLWKLERILGVLIEHYADDFSLWLAPSQARILPVTDNEV